MNISTLFFFLCVFTAMPETSFSQNKEVSVHLNDVTLETAIANIENTSGYVFIYNEEIATKLKKRISISISNESIGKVLSLVLVGTDLAYEVKGKQVIIYNKKGPKPDMKTIAFNTNSARTETQVLSKLISGSIKDSADEPIIGAKIIEKSNPSNGTITDVNGNFSLTVKNNAIVSISSLGFLPEDIQVTGKTHFQIVLQEKPHALEEVVVVGFGTQRRGDLTNAVSTASAEDLESRSVTNTGQALQGLIPGLNFNTAGLGGELNQPLSFNIRGLGTIGEGSNSSALVLIDGMEGDMNALNIQDIESISVLKDAAAASIYGSRAPFGVILITTKKGRAGKTVINYNNNLRWTQPLGLPKMLDSYRFALYFNEAAQNEGDVPHFEQEALDRILAYQKGEITTTTIKSTWDNYWPWYHKANANTDWFKEQYKSAAFSHEHNLSISGGGKKNQYYVAANFMDQSGLGRYTKDGLKRYTLTSKINTQLNDYVRFNYTNRFIREDYQRATAMTDYYYHLIARRWPTNAVKDPNGHYSEPSDIIQLIDGGMHRDQQDWLYQQGQLTITPVKDWNIVADLNYRITNYNMHEDVLPAYAYDMDNKPYLIGVTWRAPGYTDVQELSSKRNYLSTNLYSDYSFKLTEHQFKALLGFNSEYDHFRNLGIALTDLITPRHPTLNSATKDPRLLEQWANGEMMKTGRYDHWSTAGFFGRLNYNYANRYLLELNGRIDGSSRFLRDQRWNFFPSASAGWVATEEPFWPENSSINMLKFRGSYGTLGNQNTNKYYPFYPTQPFRKSEGNWLVEGEKPNIAWAPGLISTMLTWERVSSWNVGFDLYMLDNRLSFIFNYFNRITSGMVGPAPELPLILGTPVPLVNNTEMKSYGFDFEAMWKDKIGELNYSVRAVLSDDQTIITDYPNSYSNIDRFYSGQKIGNIWGYKTLGIAKTQEEMDAHLAHTNQTTIFSNWCAGDIMYEDLNKDGHIDGGKGVLGDTGDRTIIGNSYPRFRYSVDLNADWKGFDMRIFIQGVGKRDYMPNGPYFWGANWDIWQSAGFETHMDYFRDENSIMVQGGAADVNLDSYFPKPYFRTAKNQENQTRYIQNAAYLRVKNVQLGYTFPAEWVKFLKTSKLRVFFSGENLLTFTKLIKTFDPEALGLSGWQDGKTYPLAKVYSFGLNVNF